MEIPLLAKKRGVGIDIGTFSIKIAQVKLSGEGPVLENIGMVPASAVFKGGFRTFERDTLLISTEQVEKGLKILSEETGIKLNKVCFSLPDFVSFFSTFEIPSLKRHEIPLVVKTEARKYLPIGLTEVDFTWKIVETSQSGYKIVLIAFPKEVTHQYKLIAQNLKIKEFTFDPEMISLSRIFGEEGVVAVLDFGAKSICCSIVDDKNLKFNFSLDFGGNIFNEKISKNFGIGIEDAEELKKEYGVRDSENLLTKILLPYLQKIGQDCQKIFEEFQRREKKDVKKIILCGGGAMLPGLLHFFQQYFKIEVVIGNPFLKILTPGHFLGKIDLEDAVLFSVAVGSALKIFEK
jgi:type IV pilus assembly protein PilM